MQKICSVLIVEDNLFMRTMLKNILIHAGFSVVGEAEDAVGAIEQYKEHKPDIVTMDIIMPDRDGIETAKEIMALDANARVVMITAISQKQFILKAIEAGAKDFIVKPFNPKKVVDTIRKVIAG